MKKKLIAIITGLAMLMTSAVPAFANTTSQTATEDGSANVVITLDEAGDGNEETYTLVLPAKINLDLVQKDDGSYVFYKAFKYGAKGNLYGLDSLYVWPDVKANLSGSEWKKTAIQTYSLEDETDSTKTLDITVNTYDLARVKYAGTEDEERSYNWFSSTLFKKIDTEGQVDSTDSSDYYWRVGTVESTALDTDDLAAASYKKDITFAWSCGAY